MFSLRDSPLWFYKIFTLKNLQTIYPSNRYNLFREVAFSIRAGCFLYPSSLYSLSNIPNPSKKTQEQAKPTAILQAKPTAILQAKAHSILQAKPTTFLQAKSTTILQAKAHNLSTNKAHNLPTSKSPQPFYKQSPQPHHIPNAQKTLRKTSKSSKISPIFYPLTYF